jgi:hypothetical protein
MLKKLPQKKELHFCNSFIHYEPSRNSTGQARLSNQRPTDYPAHAGLDQLMLKIISQKKELHFCNSFDSIEPLAGIEPATY